MLSSSGTLTYLLINNYGTLSNSGTLENIPYGYSDTATLNNYGTLTNSGALDNVPTVDVVTSTLNNYGTLNNSGTLTNSGNLNNFGTLTNSGVLYNSGNLLIASGASLVNDNSSGLGTYTQSAGSTVVDGLFSSSTTIQINGGKLSGSGTIQGDVAIGGIISPGDFPFPGKLTIDGNYTQLSGGTFYAKLAGMVPGTQYDQLVVSGTAALDGTLGVALLNGFVVQLGDSFVLMTYGSESGHFSEVIRLSPLPYGEMWQISYNTSDLTLTAVPSPEPSGILLLGSGVLAGIGALTRRRHRRNALRKPL